MKIEDIDKAMRLKYDYDLLATIASDPNFDDEAQHKCVYMSFFSNGKNYCLPESLSVRLVAMVKEEMQNIKKQIEEL